MKKYDLSNIMKQAWKMVKEIGLTISAALKKILAGGKEYV